MNNASSFGLIAFRSIIKDGETTVVGGTDKKWNSSEMGGLPNPGTKVTMYWSDERMVTYILEPISDFMDYVEQIKSIGFTEDIAQSEIDGIYIFTASNSEGAKVTFSWMMDVCTIAYEKAN